MNSRLLKALAVGLKYDVSYVEDRLHIEDKSEEWNGYGAIVDGDSKTIFVTGCYNSSVDWVELDMEKIKELNEFVEVLTETEDPDVQIVADKVRQLREHTGAGRAECERALERADGDILKAYDALLFDSVANFTGTTFKPKEGERNE